MNLKELLFLTTATELDGYLYLSNSPYYSENEIEVQRQRFCSLYQLIEKAGLEDEYLKWKLITEQCSDSELLLSALKGE